jgi:hypothetical protein
MITTRTLYLSLAMLCTFVSLAQLPDHQWSTAFPGYNGGSYGGVAMDASGAIYWYTNFYDLVDVDPGPGIVSVQGVPSQGSSTGDCFLAKYSPNGEYL